MAEPVLLADVVAKALAEALERALAVERERVEATAPPVAAPLEEVPHV